MLTVTQLAIGTVRIWTQAVWLSQLRMSSTSYYAGPPLTSSIKTEKTPLLASGTQQ